MRPYAPLLLQFAAGHDRTERHAVGKGFGDAHDIGHDAGLLEGPHLPGSPDARLDLVADEHDAVLVAQGPKLPQE